MDTAATREFLRAQMANRPESRLQDLCKALYQSTFGCGHLISDVAAAEQSIREELADVLSYCVLMADVCGLMGTSGPAWGRGSCGTPRADAGQGPRSALRISRWRF